MLSNQNLTIMDAWKDINMGERQHRDKFVQVANWLVPYNDT